MSGNYTDGTCRYCGSDYTDPNGVASDEYMRQGHLLNDCPNVPEKVFNDLNDPPTEREQHTDSDRNNSESSGVE